jgi:hypothetical protein
VPTLALHATAEDLAALGEQRFPTPVLTNDGVLMGSVQPEAAQLPGDTAIAEIMNPAPGTIRPEQRVEEVIDQLRRDGLDHTFVTAVNGTLFGLVVTAELHVCCSHG